VLTNRIIGPALCRAECYPQIQPVAIAIAIAIAIASVLALADKQQPKQQLVALTHAQSTFHTLYTLHSTVFP